MDNFTHFFNTKKGILHTFLPRILATLLILFSATFAIADTTQTFETNKSTITGLTVSGKAGLTLTFSANSLSSTEEFFKFIRDNTLTISCTDENITDITIYYQNYAGSNKKGKTITADNGTFTYNAGLNSSGTVDHSTWSGSSKSITISNDASNGGELRITSIVVTTSGVTAPTFTPAAGS